MKHLFLSAIAAILLSATIGFGQQNKIVTSTTSDPASVTLAALFAQADVVAFVEIRSGDAENYNVAIYKARVLKAYKGANDKEIIYFTPFISYGLGSEYLVFLKKSGHRIEDLVPKENERKLLPYEPKHAFYQIMYAGYSVLPVSFECVFGKPAHENCGYAVKVNIKQVKLPTQLKAFPQTDEESDVRHVKRGEIESLLESLQRGK